MRWWMSFSTKNPKKKNEKILSKVRADEVDEQGNTALHLAAQGDHNEVCIRVSLYNKIYTKI